jgi:hypothetical protein
MTCKRWNDEWVAKLYDELDPEEAQRLAGHLDECDECRQTLDELDQSRQMLQASSPYVPASPRVIVLRPSGIRPLWAFASGLAAALLVFAVGLWMAQGMIPSPATPDEAAQQARLATEAEARAALESRVDLLEQALTRSDDSSRQLPPSDTLQAMITRDEFEHGLQSLKRKVDVSRARDMEFVLGEMTAVEWRAGKWVDETREAVRLVALQQDPRLSER